MAEMDKVTILRADPLAIQVLKNQPIQVFTQESTHFSDQHHDMYKKPHYAYIYIYIMYLYRYISYIQQLQLLQLVAHSPGLQEETHHCHGTLGCPWPP